MKAQMKWTEESCSIHFGSTLNKVYQIMMYHTWLRPRRERQKMRTELDWSDNARTGLPGSWNRLLKTNTTTYKSTKHNIAAISDLANSLKNMVAVVVSCVWIKCTKNLLLQYIYIAGLHKTGNCYSPRAIAVAIADLMKSKHSGTLEKTQVQWSTVKKPIEMC